MYNSGILWNHSYSLGPMFVDCKPGRDFVGNWFAVLQYRTIHYVFKRPWGRLFAGKGNSRKLDPLEQ